MSEENKERVRNFFRGRPHSPEHTEKQRKSMMLAWSRKTPEERAEIAEKGAQKNRGRKIGPMSEEHRRKIGEAQQKKWASGTRKPLPSDVTTDARRARWPRSAP